MNSNGIAEEKFCRLCLEQRTIYFSIFENRAAQMLEALTSIKVDANDVFSVDVCAKCLLDLKTAFNIQQRLIKNESALQEKLLNIAIKEEIEDAEIKEEDSAQPPLTFETVYVPNEALLETRYLEKSNEIFIEFMCEICLIKFSTAEEYVKHSDIHLNRNCGVCRKDVNIKDFIEHQKTHESGFCEFCGITLKNKDSLRAHIRLVHCEEEILCDECGLVSCNLQRHELHKRRVHTREASHICDKCGKEHFTLSELNRHISVKHSKERPHVCDNCEEGFATKQALYVHKLKHSDEMLFICEFCGHGSKFAANMRTHKRVKHSWRGDESCKCKICGKGFATNIALAQHCKIHKKIDA